MAWVADMSAKVTYLVLSLCACMCVCVCLSYDKGFEFIVVYILWYTVTHAGIAIAAATTHW